MCGRYTFKPSEKFFDRFDIVNHDLQLRANYNVTPGSFMPIIVSQSPNRVELMKWGLIPSWAKDPTIGFRMINARSETAAEKPSFRHAFKSQRCLVPATGFYEWQKTDEGKIPYLAHLPKDELFAMAGLYEIWEDAEGKELKTFTILTVTPSKVMKEIHDRMPVILTKREEKKWLDKDSKPEELKKLLDPNEKIKAYSVSRDVNKPANNSESLLQKVNY